MTAEVRMVNPLTKKVIPAVALIDTASTVSLMREELAEKLNLEVEKCEKVALVGLSGAMLKEEQGRKAKAKIATSVGEQMCDFLLMEYPLVGELPSIQLCPEDKEFLLEKDVDEKIAWDKKPPDILLGVKESIQILKNCETLEMPSGLQLIHSNIGWIIAGEMGWETPQNQEEAVALCAKNPKVENGELSALMGKVKKKAEPMSPPRACDSSILL